MQNKYQSPFLLNTINNDHFLDKHVSCREHDHQYVPPLWIMCLESVAHLLVMLNSSSNFLIYCSVSKQFKTALARRCLGFIRQKGSLQKRYIPKKTIYIDKDTTGILEYDIDNTKAEEMEIPGCSVNETAFDLREN